MRMLYRFEEALVPLPVASEELRMCGSDTMARRVMSQSAVMQLLNRITSLPGIVGPTVVLPDLTVKCFGLPSGLIFRSRNMLYPCAVPDVADGYLVVNTGWRIEKSFADCAAASLEMIENFFDRRTSVVLNDSVCPERLRHLGECALGHDRVLQCTHNGSEQIDIEIDGSVFRGLIDESLTQFGRLVGQYISMYIAQSDAPAIREGEVILVVHSGAEILRALMYEEVILPLALEASGTAEIDHFDLQSGLFGVYDGKILGQKFLAIADIANRVAFATRRWVAEHLMQVLGAIFSSGPERPVVLQHSRHVSVGARALENGDTEYEFCRGVQRVGQPFSNGSFFVAGGPNNHAAIMCSSDPRCVCYFAHGTSQMELSAKEAIKILGRSPVHISDIKRRRLEMRSNFVDRLERSLIDSAYLEEIIEFYQRCELAFLQTRLIPFVNFRDPELNIT